MDVDDGSMDDEYKPEVGDRPFKLYALILFDNFISPCLGDRHTRYVDGGLFLQLSE